MRKRQEHTETKAVMTAPRSAKRIRRGILLTCLGASLSLIPAAAFFFDPAKTAFADNEEPVSGGGETEPSYVIEVTSEKIDTMGFTAAVQEALDEAAQRSVAATAACIYTVTIPEGSYVIGDRPLFIKSNTTLDLTGVTVTMDPSVDTGTVFWIGEWSDKSTGYYYHDITFLGGTVDGSDKGTFMIRGAHAYNILIDGMTAENVNTSHFMEFTACHDMTIQNCLFRNAESTDQVNYEAIQFDVMTDNHFGVGYYQEALPNYNITVTNCTFMNVQSGVGSHTGYYDAPSANFTITGNNFFGLEGIAVQTLNWTDSVISNNTIIDSESGILIRLYGSFNSAFGTYCRNSDQIGENRDETGAYVPKYPDAAYSCPEDCRLLVEENQISLKAAPGKDDSYGIRVCGLDYQMVSISPSDGSGNIPVGRYPLNGCSILNNTIRSNVYGIRLSETGSGILVKGNEVSNLPSDKTDGKRIGIFLADNASADEISNNVISVQGIGIHVLDGSSVREVKENRIVSEMDQAICANHGSRISSVTSNQILYSARSAIYSSESSRISLVSENQIGETGESAVCAYQADFGEISGNTIGKSVKSAILLTDGSFASLIKDNQIAGADEHSIYLFKNSSADTVENNHIFGGAKTGILVMSGSFVGTIRGNEIDRPNENGIMINSGGAGTITDNTITGAGANGIYLFNESSARSILRNRVDFAGDTAICFSNPGGADAVPKTNGADTVRDNVITNCPIGFKLYHYCRIKELRNNSVTKATKNAVAAASHSVIENLGGLEVWNSNWAVSYGADSTVYGIWSKQDASEAKTQSTYQFQVSIPQGKTVKSWSSSKTDVASIDSKGKMSCLRAGTTTITVKLSDGTTYTSDQKVLFRDVTTSTDFFFDAVYWGSNNGIVEGYNDKDTFRPGNDCNRAQMVTFLWRMAGRPEPKNTVSPFKDVQDTKTYFYKAVLWGSENEIVAGYKLSDGTFEFRPTGQCTRQQAVTFMWRLAGKPEPVAETSVFKDVRDPNTYYYKAVLWASENGITSGYTDGTFRPTGNCLRRQMVTFLYRYHNNIGNF